MSRSTPEGGVDIPEGKGSDPVYDHYLSDTLFGLVECLDNDEAEPGCVKLFGIYRGKQSELDTSMLIDCEGRRRKRPAPCHALEQYYDITREECHRGHVEKGHCLFEDRDRSGEGPVW